jgi:predicted secreted protein
VISTWFAIYFVLWWVTLFVTLPLGVRSQHEDGVGAPGSDPGAPIASQTGRKMIWTTAHLGSDFSRPACSPIMLAISRSRDCRS